MKGMIKIILMKFIGGTMVVICGALCGLYFSAKLNRRTKFMEQYLIFLTQAKAMISYSHTEIPNILVNVSGVPLLSEMLRECHSYMSGGENFSSAWRSAAKSAYEKGLLFKEDIRLFTGFGDSFGNMGCDEEESKSQLYIELVENRLEQLRNELLTKRKLYRVIGTFSGVMAAVILC